MHEHGFPLERVESGRHIGFLGKNARTGRVIDGSIADIKPVEDRKHIGVETGWGGVHGV
jgi:hypothetical protein